MTDDPQVGKLDQLLEKLTAFRERADDKFGQLHQDNLRTNERITKQSQGFHDDLSRLNNRLDLVAAQVATVGDEVTEVKEIVVGHSEDLDKIQRRLNLDLDRLDDHGTRIEALEVKTGHHPTPPRSR